MLLIEDRGRCENCKNLVKTDFKRGRVICDNCGLVKESSFIDQSSEYRFFSENNHNNNDPRRVGNNVNTHMDAQIDLVDIDDGKNSYHVYAAYSNQDRYFQGASKMIKKYCGILGLTSQIIKFSENIIYEVMDKQGLRGKRLEHIVIATIYLACKRNYINIHPLQLEPLCDIKQNQILKICKIIIKELPPVTITSQQYAEMFCNKMSIKVEAKKDIIKICTDINNWDIFDNKLPKPKTIAATVIYFYLSKLNLMEQKTLAEIRDAAGICTDNTIKKYFQNLEAKIPYINQLLGKDIRNLNPEKES